MVKIVIPCCSICGKPLSEAEKKLNVSAHFPCIFHQAYGK